VCTTRACYRIFTTCFAFFPFSHEFYFAKSKKYSAICKLQTVNKFNYSAQSAAQKKPAKLSPASPCSTVPVLTNSINLKNNTSSMLIKSLEKWKNQLTLLLQTTTWSWLVIAPNNNKMQTQRSNTWRQKNGNR
jgi:hypothetical protein